MWLQYIPYVFFALARVAMEQGPASLSRSRHSNARYVPVTIESRPGKSSPSEYNPENYETPIRSSKSHRHSSFQRVSQGSTGLSVDKLVSFGTDHGDSVMQPADDAYIEIPLAKDPFIFVKTPYSNVFLNTNGFITMINGTIQFLPQCGPLPLPMILPLWADPDIRLGGNIFFRQATDTESLAEVGSFIQKAFPDGSPKLEWALVATTFEVPFCYAQPETDTCPGLGLRNTFQVILARGAVDSYILFLYNKIQWTDSPNHTYNDGGDPCTGMNGKHPAMAGFDTGDGVSRFVLPGSCSTNAINLASTSNIKLPGAWVFRVTDTILSPCDVKCDPGVQYRSDPYDCHSYYECANNIPYKMACPGDLVFNPAEGVDACDHPERYECSPICEH